MWILRNVSDLRLYDACSDPQLARKALQKSLQEHKCHNAYTLGQC